MQEPFLKYALRMHTFNSKIIHSVVKADVLHKQKVYHYMHDLHMYT